ncbi:amidohydrolase family protein, partial [Bacillus amyloliquefaciens]|uniref:amidohydrolase family protein n=1 Tax=Bacillus amyloliquefaciens TaxID=1390 RepID=UPI0037D51512
PPDEPRAPLDVFGSQVVASFIEDDTGLVLLDRIGRDRVLWQSDFPHADSYWPQSRRMLEASLAAVPDDAARAVAETNARALLRLPRPN